MGPLLRLAYGLTGRLAHGLAAVAPAREAKLWRTLRARRGIGERYEAWARASRDPSRALLWMHAPSVGEGLQARPILALARERRSDAQLAYTFFSPSAERFARGLDVDFRDYLPFDTAADARMALDALAPRALVFSKVDVWPALAREASRRGVRLGLTSATLAPGSGRGGALSRRLLGDAYARLDRVGAIDAADAERLVALGVRQERIEVTGDTRYDQVWARAHAAERPAAVRDLATAIGGDRPTLVAGSTWPADEAVLLDAWTRLAARERRARLIIAPHEPTSEHLAPIERWASGAGLRLSRLSAACDADTDVVLVDRVGVLGDLYALADVAYVGGGFHAAGLHSVLEPAAFGSLVLFGPRHANSRDASLLLAAGGGSVVATALELEKRLARWLADVGEAREAGRVAQRVVRDGLGAAERSWALVEALLG